MTLELPDVIINGLGVCPGHVGLLLDKLGQAHRRLEHHGPLADDHPVPDGVVETGDPAQVHGLACKLLGQSVGFQNLLGNWKSQHSQLSAVSCKDNQLCVVANPHQLPILKEDDLLIRFEREITSVQVINILGTPGVKLVPLETLDFLNKRFDFFFQCWPACQIYKNHVSCFDDISKPCIRVICEVDIRNRSREIL